MDIGLFFLTYDFEGMFRDTLDQPFPNPFPVDDSGDHGALFVV